MRTLEPDRLSGRDRYQLLTSLVVPRPIAWISTRSEQGVANLAPFSYFSAIASTPMLIAASIGTRPDRPKDTLRNIRDRGSFCVNVVTEGQLAAMNRTSGDFPPDVDEFEAAGLTPVQGEVADAPYVEGCPAVLECLRWREVELPRGGALVLGEVKRLHLSEDLRIVPGTHNVDARSLRPVARLWGGLYATLGDLVELERPRV